MLSFSAVFFSVFFLCLRFQKLPTAELLSSTIPSFPKFSTRPPSGSECVPCRHAFQTRATLYLCTEARGTGTHGSGIGNLENRVRFSAAPFDIDPFLFIVFPRVFSLHSFLILLPCFLHGERNASSILARGRIVLDPCHDSVHLSLAIWHCCSVPSVLPLPLRKKAGILV